MRLEDYDEHDPTFIEDLRKSKEAVAVAAKWLSGLGYPVVVRPVFERGSATEMKEFSDDGDLEIMQRVEVKRRHCLTFTSKSDFPYQTVIVDACHCYDKAKPKPYAYLILNRDMTSAFVVNVRDPFTSWTRVEKRDRFKGRLRSFYECPVDLVSFVRFE